jgi:acyl dehydratase
MEATPQQLTEQESRSAAAAPVTLDALRARAGEKLGVSTYHEVTQSAINGFAEVTGDYQWIHTDPERAATTPFGGTIAHGYYTLSLAPALLEEVLPLDHFAMAVNYGLDKLRFPAPLPVGRRVRMHVALDGVEAIPGGAQLNVKLSFECEGTDKPVCIAQALYRVFEAGPAL